MQNVIHAIQDDIRLGVLSFSAIARKHGVSFMTVEVVWQELCEQENA